MKEYYKRLGLQENASFDEIKKAYKLYVSKYHPDKHSGDEFFKERFQEIQEAYEVVIKNHKKNTQTTETPTKKEKQKKENNDYRPLVNEFYADKYEVNERDIIHLKWDTNFPKVYIGLYQKKHYSSGRRMQQGQIKNLPSKSELTINLSDYHHIFPWKRLEIQLSDDETRYSDNVVSLFFKVKASKRYWIESCIGYFGWLIVIGSAIYVISWFL